MPFCTSCGKEVSATAAYCANCGARQSPPGPQTEPFAASMSDRTVTILCYIPFFGFIPALLVLVSQRYRTNIKMRFDAFQSLYLFLAGMVLNALGSMFAFAGPPELGFTKAAVDIGKLALVVAWIYALVKATQQQQVRLPIIGDLAARSTYEQA